MQLADAGFALHLGLVKHDTAIVKAEVRRLTKRTGDFLIVLIGMPLVALNARAWLSGLPSNQSDLVAYGVGAVIATLTSKALLERVWFHQSEGVLAHFAQKPSEWLSYMLPVMVAGILVSLSGMAAVGILHLECAMLGIGSGIPTGLAIPIVRERVRRWWRDITPKRGPDLLRHQHALIFSAVVSAAIGAICAFLPQEGYFGAISMGGYGLAVILLTGRVDASTVCYMTLMGHSSTSLLRHWLPIQFALLLPIAAVLLLAQSWAAAGVAVLVALGLPIITALRIFAYRAFSRLIGDWMVTGLIAAAGYAALTFPPLGPVIVVAAIVWLARQGSGSRWLLT